MATATLVQGIVGAKHVLEGASVEQLREAFSLGIDRCVFGPEEPEENVLLRVKQLARQIRWAVSFVRPCGRLSLSLTNGELRLAVDNGDTAVRWPVVARWRTTGAWRTFMSTPVVLI